MDILILIVIGLIAYIILTAITMALWFLVIRKRVFPKQKKRKPTPLPIQDVPVTQVPPPPVAASPAATQASSPAQARPVVQGPGLLFVLDSGASPTFTSLPIAIGRAEENDLILDDETISAVHARVYYDERIGEICIADNDSLNGLFINDLPTRKNILENGVKIRLGNVQFTFHNTGYTHPGSTGSNYVLG